MNPLTILLLLLSLPLLTSTTPNRTPTLNIVSHQDDDILFQSPSLIHNLRSPSPHRTIFLTAGDAGNTSSYWQSREAGSRAAYAQMLSLPNTWVESDAGIRNHPVSVFTLAARDSVSLAFMHLPDGSPDGSGFESTGNRSLRKLWEGEVEALDNVDGRGERYSNETLVGVLAEFIGGFGPGRVYLQDYVSGEGDHTDHFYGARFAREAVRRASLRGGEARKESEIEVVGFMGYPVVEEPENVFGRELREKKEAFYAYSKYDWMTCKSDEDCKGGIEERWLAREVIVG